MDLQSFIKIINKESELLTINKSVSLQYELPAIVKTLKGRPVLFNNVENHKMKVVSNICASRELVCLGLGIETHQLNEKLQQAIANPLEPACIPNESYQMIGNDLSSLPIPIHYEKDGGPYIASGIAVACDPEYGPNCSYHRAMVMGKNQMALRIVERHLHQYNQRGLNKFAFCIGNPLSVQIGAAISAGIEVNELAIANALQEIKTNKLDELLVPESEIVIICRFTGEMTEEGPFLDLTETFDIIRKQPIVEVEKIFIRKDAVFHALLPGDWEHKMLMGVPREPTIFREVAKVCRCIDVRITPGGCSWLHGAIKIQKEKEDDGKKAIEAAFRGHASMKHVFIVDHDINIDDPHDIEWAMATRFQGNEDMIIREKEKGSSLDPSSDSETKETTKIGFDLTAPIGKAREKFSRAGASIEINPADYLF